VKFYLTKLKLAELGADIQSWHQKMVGGGRGKMGETTQPAVAFLSPDGGDVVEWR
jgi:hypothetical protein